MFEIRDVILTLVRFLGQQANILSIRVINLYEWYAQQYKLYEVIWIIE